MEPENFGSWESYLYPPPDHGTLRNLFDERHGPGQGPSKGRGR